MIAVADRTPTERHEWFASWFDSPHYHRLYAGRDEAEAARFVDTLIGRLRPRQGAAVLDLGCGTGRHARRLASNGFEVTGLDLAADSIRLAREHERPGLRFGRHDMRAAFGDETFDCVFNLFTSFGYFERADEHLAVVRNVSRSLKAGGRFVLDFLNVKRAEAQLTPHEMVVRDGVRYAIARWADADHIFKRIDVHAADGSSPRTYLERVAKFTLEDFRLMFALYGLRAEEIYGDYELGRFDVETSPRLIVVARKTDDTAKADYLRERFLRMRLNVSGETPRYEASMR